MAVFCNTATPEYVQTDCGVENSGVVFVGYVDRTVGTPSNANLASATYWNALTNQSPPLAYFIPKTRGEYARPTVTSAEGWGRESNENTSADHLLTFEHEGILANQAFYESVNRKKWKMFFITAGNLLHYIDEPVSIDGRMVNARDIKGEEIWGVEAKWATMSNPRVVDVSALSIFQD